MPNEVKEEKVKTAKGRVEIELSDLKEKNII